MAKKQQVTESYETSVKKAIGEYANSFTQTMKWLKNKWEGSTDSEEMRLMSPIILHETNPINISIIADNLEYFKKHYKEAYKQDYQSKLVRALNRACLCGSRQIAEFLLKELNVNYLSKEYGYLLAYAAASPNIEWAKEIAIAMAKAKKTLPNEIFALADDKAIDTIVKIFK